MVERIVAGTTVRSRRVVTSSGDGVHVLETAAASHPAVVLHGTGIAAGFLMPLLEKLDGVHALAPDLPGQGLSDPADLPRNTYPSAAVAWLDRLLDALELDTTAMVGHSGGGRWALWYALARPERVTRLVLIAPPGLPGTRCPLLYRLLATPGLGALLTRVAPPTRRSVLQFARFMGEGESLPRHPDLVDLFVAEGRDPIAAAAARTEVQALIPPYALLSRSGFRRRTRVTADELRRLAMPTMLMWGEQEPLGSRSVARGVTDLIPDARLEVVPGGHAPWLGHPERTAAAVTGFLH